MLSTAHSPLARAGLGPMMGVTRASQATVADLLTRLRLAIFAARFGSFLWKYNFLVPKKTGGVSSGNTILRDW